MTDFPTYTEIAAFLNQWDMEREAKQWPKVSIPEGWHDARGGRRQPETPLEAWAWAGVAQLHACNFDQASARNGIGFNKIDSGFGKSLAEQQGSGWTDKQFQAAIKIARKYQGQIGPRPE